MEFYLSLECEARQNSCKHAVGSLEDPAQSLPHAMLVLSLTAAALLLLALSLLLLHACMKVLCCLGCTKAAVLVQCNLPPGLLLLFAHALLLPLLQSPL